jgi:HAMP domain-containing protein
MYSRPTRGWTSWIPLRRWPIRNKLALALVVPTVALVIMSGYRYLDISQQTQDTKSQTRLAAAADGPTGLVLALQNERNFTVVEIIGQVGLVALPVDNYDTAYGETNSAMEGFQEQLREGEDETIAAYERPIENLFQIEDLRRRVAEFTGPGTLDPLSAGFADEIFADYTALIEPFFEGTSQIADAVDDPDLRQGALLVDQAAREAETIGQLARYVIAYALTTEGGVNTPEEIDRLASLWGQSQRYYHSISLAISGRYADLPYDHFAGFFEGMRVHIEPAMNGGPFDVMAFLDSVNIENELSYNGFRDNAATRLNEIADEINHDAVTRQRFTLIVTLVTVALAAAAIVAASLSITRPLQSLRQQADRMARRDLPEAVAEVLATPLGEDVPTPDLEPIGVSSHDEVADLAGSLNQVQQSTLRLAVGQAVLRKNVSDSLVNLGRRNQSLLARQLDFITRLEQNEANPDTLANLFRLDHLATRMRRNAESLLVLAGVQTPRRWSAPVKVTDTIRAALSEVEDYRRVSIGYVEAVTIPGTVAADLAHLMAELIENALIFSPPEEGVQINGLSQIAGYTLTIVDRGLGMRPYEVAQANRRLAGAESFTVAPSKYLGHYVAGNLSTRHNLHVQLRPTPGHGVTASIHVPAWLAAPEEGASTPARYSAHLTGGDLPTDQPPPGPPAGLQGSMSEVAEAIRTLGQPTQSANGAPALPRRIPTR